MEAVVAAAQLRVPQESVARDAEARQCCADGVGHGGAQLASDGDQGDVAAAGNVGVEPELVANRIAGGRGRRRGGRGGGGGHGGAVARAGDRRRRRGWGDCTRGEEIGMPSGQHRLGLSVLSTPGTAEQV